MAPPASASCLKKSARPETTATAMPDRTLRALARQYAKGEIDKDSYRRSRSEFIEGVLSGQIPLQVNEYPAPRSLARSDSAGEAIRRRQRKQEEPEGTDITSIMVTTDPTPRRVTPPEAEEPEEPIELPPAPEPETRFPLSYVLAAAGGVALIAVIVFALLPESTPQPGTAVATGPETAPVQVETAEPAEAIAASEAPTLSRPAASLILKFLADKNWSEPARTEFLNQWQALPDDQRAGAAQSGEMAQLNNSIYKKLQAERALSGLGDTGESIEKQRSLVEFAAALGIQDPRLTVPPAAQQ